MRSPGFIKKIQTKPLWVRQLMLWTVVILVGGGLMVCWARTGLKRLENLKGVKIFGDVQIPAFGEEIKKIQEQMNVGKEVLEKAQQPGGQTEGLENTVTPSSQDILK